MTHMLDLECHNEQEVVSEMSGFGIVYSKVATSITVNLRILNMMHTGMHINRHSTTFWNLLERENNSNALSNLFFGHSKYKL